MPIYVGGNKISEIYIGSTKIQEVYVGSQRVYIAKYLLTNGSLGFNIGQYGSITPSQLDGATINGVYFTYYADSKLGTFRYLHVDLAGNRAQNFFTSLTESSIGTFPTSSATHSYDSGSNETNWVWSSSTFGNWGSSSVLELEFQ